MASSSQSVILQHERRRELAAVLLRGVIEPYDHVPLVAEHIDHLIDEMLRRAARSTDADWERLAADVADRFSYRLSDSAAHQHALSADHLDSAPHHA